MCSGAAMTWRHGWWLPPRCCPQLHWQPPLRCLSTPQHPPQPPLRGLLAWGRMHPSRPPRLSKVQLQLACHLATRPPPLHQQPCPPLLPPQQLCRPHQQRPHPPPQSAPRQRLARQCGGPWPQRCTASCRACTPGSSTPQAPPVVHPARAPSAPVQQVRPPCWLTRPRWRRCAGRRRTPSSRPHTARPSTRCARTRSAPTACPPTRRRWLRCGRAWRRSGAGRCPRSCRRCARAWRRWRTTPRCPRWWRGCARGWTTRSGTGTSRHPPPRAPRVPPPPTATTWSRCPDGGWVVSGCSCLYQYTTLLTIDCSWTRACLMW
mmetsp:Transcript_36994/g.93291  ORF Transcript_36994/g.93291 Transcript_36994/m.93291 type:complete len:319 (+) Transcript_36994:535-1491(+)